MLTRITSHLLKTACIAAVVCGMASPSTACWFPGCWWNSYPTYRPVYYGSYYGPGYGSACSPCATGACGVQTYYGPAVGCSACGCVPCSCAVGCSPCGIGSSACGIGGNCGISYAPGSDPVPDDGASVNRQGSQTYADEATDETGNDTETNLTAPGDDDFEAVEREESEATTDPFPEFERPVLPMETEDDEESAPQPLSELDDESVTLRVSPRRERVRAEARYRVPRIVRLEVKPLSPWQAPGELIETHVVSR